MVEYKLQGWVSRDKYPVYHSNLYVSQQKPNRDISAEEDSCMWVDCGEFMALPPGFFPQLTYKDEPIEVEIIIKLKNKQNEDLFESEHRA